MCRIILAVGRFEARRVLDAAALMSEGVTAIQAGPTSRHRDGWGAIFRLAATGELLAHRSTRPLAEGPDGLAVPDGAADLLAVHARHATLPHTRGLAFTHPVTREGSPWFLMHKGFLPTVHRELGLGRSVFDTGEYFDFAVPRRGLRLRGRELAARLERLAPGGTSANAFFINPERAYALNWFPAASPFAGFYRMWSLRSAGAIYIASDPIPALGAIDRWEALSPGRPIEIPLAKSLPRTIPRRFSIPERNDHR